MLLSLIFKNKIKNFTPLIFMWAIFVSYSRIYNGVHYPADVAVGAIVGMGIGIAVYKLFVLGEKKLYKTT
jgi:undecaprenyl-diphosphatase